MNNSGGFAGCVPPVFLITGERGEGKTTTLGRVIERLKDERVAISGIITLGTVKDGLRNSFTVVNVATNVGVQLCSRETGTNGKRCGEFLFNTEGLEHGFQALSLESAKGAELIVIDEVGHLELRGEGWSACIDRLTTEIDKIPMVWVVRKYSLSQVIARWRLLNPVILDINEYSADEIANMIIKKIE
ncbi:MAG: DUF2478 domain-containing protein [Methanomicrobiales archaeon]|nr:DUF2478 domain-containing protein [Methanomicrobiales archaeon]